MMGVSGSVPAHSAMGIVCSLGASGARILDCAAEARAPAARTDKVGGESRRCCRFLRSSRDDEPARFREEPRAGAPGQKKSLGTDAFTASFPTAVITGDCRSSDQ